MKVRQTLVELIGSCSCVSSRILLLSFDSKCESESEGPQDLSIETNRAVIASSCMRSPPPSTSR